MAPRASKSIVLSFFLVIASLAWAQIPDQLLTGTVVDSSDSPVEEVVVELLREGSRTATMTARDGSFAFDGLFQGEYEIRATEGPRATVARILVGSGLAPVRLVLASPAFADAITVTAARGPEPILDTRESITVLDRKELATTAASRVDDALRQVAGFTLFRRTSSRVANPTTQGASLRGVGGSGASRALVLDDGFPLNDPFGGWVAWGRVPRLALERIEVLRGASSLYGTSALSGVVQLVRRSDEPARIDIEASAGGDSTNDVAVSAAGRVGGWHGSISAESFSTGGYVTVAPESRGSIDRPATSSQRAADVTLAHSSDASSAFVRVSAFEESRDNGTPLQTNATSLRQMGFGWDGRVAGEVSVRAYATTEGYDQTFTSISADRSQETLTRLQHVPSDAQGLLAQWRHPFSADHELLAGIEGLRVAGESQETSLVGAGGQSSAGGRQIDAAIFAEARSRFSPRLSMSAGFRLDRWEERGNGANASTRTQTAFSPKLSLGFDPTSAVSLSTSVYRSFRAPTLNELYRSFQAGGVVTLANDALGPERGRGAEAGIRLIAPSSRFLGGARYFWMEVDDSIANVTLSSTQTTITRRRENLARTRSRGVELDLQGTLGRGWSASASALYTGSTVVESPAAPGIVGNRIPQVPRHQETLQIRYSGARTCVGLQARYAASMFEDDQNQRMLGTLHTLDLFASVRVKGPLEVFVAAENLFDDEYDTGRTPVRTVGTPRTVRAGIRLGWTRRDAPAP